MSTPIDTASLSVNVAVAPVSADNAAVAVKAEAVNTKKIQKPKTPKVKKTAASRIPKKSANGGGHPAYKDMVANAISSLAAFKGSSRTAILNHILANNDVGADKKHVTNQLRLSLLRETESGFLIRTKGTGAAGTFKLAKKTSKKSKAPKTTAVGSGDDAKKSKKTGTAKRKSETKKGGATSSSLDKPATPKPKKSKKPSAKPSPKVTHKKATTTKKSASPIKKAATKPKKSPAKKSVAPAASSKAKKSTMTKKKGTTTSETKKTA